VAGSVYVSGGSERTTRWTPERNFWMLAPNAPRWERLPDMPEGRMGHQMVAVAGKVYVVGGRGGGNVLIYDIGARAWSTGAEIPVARDHLGVAVLGTKVFAIGGRDTDLLRRVDVYDTVSDAWSEGPALPVPMSAMATGATMVPDRAIHVVGGEEPATVGGYVLDRHFRLDADGVEWVADPLPILPTHGSAAVVIDGRLYITGGARRQGALSPLGWTGRTETYAPDLL
ncbi:MAG TPA: kelch repeat-containing protein, partial [Actinomycetota bacterium]|nr:kelch repeat-containing protein [Actinomycetota bacterium]